MNRRSFLKTISLGAVGLVGAGVMLGGCEEAFSAAAKNASSLKKPNIILILIDDMAWNGTSIRMDDDIVNSGMPILKMPRLEKFASQGMRFRNAYAAAPQCAPSRVAIQTGQSSARNGFTVTLGSKRNTYPEPDPDFPYFYDKKDLKYFPLRTNTSDLNLDRKEITIAEALKPRGYQSAHFGKWHMNGATPADHGYSEHDGNTNNKPGNAPNIGDPKLMVSVTDKSIDFMKRKVAKETPFYLQISHYAIHARSQCFPEAEAKYASHPRIIAEYADDKNKGRRKNNTSKLAKWFGMTEDLDRSIGRVLDEVDTLGIADNTYIVIVSDNGYQHWRADQQQALHGKKWWVWDGGLRVPMFVRGPGIKAGAVDHTNVVHYDFLPTFIELTGGNVSKHPATLDGISLKPLLMGKKTPDDLENRSLYFHYPHYRTSMPGSAMITKNWKVLHWYEDADVPLLFNLADDIGETKSVVKQHPELHKKMFDQMTGYLKKVGARIPEKNPNYDPKKLEAWYQADPKRLKQRDAKNALRPKR